MALNPSTDPIRIHLQDIAAARTLTGLDAGPAVRQLLREAIAARKGRKPPQDMPPTRNGATMPEEAPNG